MHDVRVGEDVSALVYDEARPGSRSPLLLRETEGGLDSLHDLRADEDDARPVAVIDLADGEAAAGPLCRGLRERALDDRCLLVLADPSGADGHDCRDQDHQAPDETGPSRASREVLKTHEQAGERSLAIHGDSCIGWVLSGVEGDVRMV